MNDPFDLDTPAIGADHGRLALIGDILARVLNVPRHPGRGPGGMDMKPCAWLCAAARRDHDGHWTHRFGQSGNHAADMRIQPTRSSSVQRDPCRDYEHGLRRHVSLAR